MGWAGVGYMGWGGVGHWSRSCGLGHAVAAAQHTRVGVGWGEVAIPVWGSPGIFKNPCSLPAQAALFSTRKCSSLEPAKWRSGNSELCEHVMYNMQTVMHVLCRYVISHTVWSQNCDRSSFFAYLCSHELILPHVLHSLKPKTAIWPHVLHSFRAKTVILPPVFHSLEIKTMMFLHLLCSFGSKTVKLPHVLTFFFNFA